jgi:hypothetical protein
MHPRTRTRSPGRRRTSLFTFQFPRPNRARRRFTTVSRGVTLRGVLPPRGASAGSFLSSHAHSRARTHGLSLTPATPAAPPRPHSATRGRVKPPPRVCCRTGGVVHACVTELRPAHVLALALALVTGHRRQPQPRRRRLGVCRHAGRDLNLAAPVVLFNVAPFFPLVDRMDPTNLIVGIVVQPLSILIGGETLSSHRSLWGNPSSTPGSPLNP